MNIFSTNLKIPGLETDDAWVYAFGGKILGEPDCHNSKTKMGSALAEKLLGKMNIEFHEVFLTQQTHGNQVYILESHSISSGRVSQIKADAIITNLKRKPIAVLTADCVPIVLYDPESKTIGIVHAGRRGTVLRVLSKAIQHMKDLYGIEKKSICAGIGPAINSCCYKVGGECIEEFRNNLSGWRRWTQSDGNGNFFLDLIAANREEALDEGLLEKNIFISNRCTACENELFYSYRKEGTGNRNVSLVMLY